MTKSITLIISIVLIHLTFCGFSQKNKQSEIHLKNGTVIEGFVLENNTDSILTIKTKNDNIIIVNRRDIENITSPEKNKHRKQRPNYQLSFDTGLLGFGGMYYTSGPTLSLMINNSFRFKDRYYAGFTTGIEYFNMPIVPTAAEFQIDIFKRDATPFIYVRGGYAFAVLKDENDDLTNRTYEGGALFGAGIGIKKHFSTEFGMYFSMGYRYQKTVQTNNYPYYYSYWPYWDMETHYFYNRLAIRVGFIF